jgi:hypothetical protein
MNKNFYPTPNSLIARMWRKIPRKQLQEIHYICESQAGAGHIIDWIKNNNQYDSFTIHAIESDPQLVAILRGKGVNVVSYDFLTYSGQDKYDLIIGNPPFDQGDKHLLKAIDILYSGHIVYLLNAETLKNPYTHTRRELVKRLDELNADIEYIQNAFIDAKRKTGVEIALIYIRVVKEIEQDLFFGVTDASDQVDFDLPEDSNEIARKDSIHNLVARYNRVIDVGTKALLDFYKNHRHISPYMSIKIYENDNRCFNSPSNLTAAMKAKLNTFLKVTRKAYWKMALDIEPVKARLTQKKREEFFELLKQNEYADFTETNVRTFVLNLINDHERILTEAVADLFDKMSRKYAWDEDLGNGNIHYFNGWKTNQAFFVNRKVIMPMYASYASYGSSFVDVFTRRWKIDWRVENQLDDIDRVMNYFDARPPCECLTITAALKQAFERGQNRGIESTYFKISVFKKGTIHLEFLNDDILRRFNVTACKHKQWLPFDYGTKPFKFMCQAEQNIVESFEGEKSYTQNLSSKISLFCGIGLKQIALDVGIAA